MRLASMFRGFLRALLPNKNKTEIAGPDDGAGLAISSAGRRVTHPLTVAWTDRAQAAAEVRASWRERPSPLQSLC